MGNLRCVAFAVIISVCFAGLAGCSGRDDGPWGDSLSNFGRIQEGDPEHAKNFWARNISLTRINGRDALFKLAAKAVVHRRRATSLFVYENVSEIVLTGLRVDFRLSPDETGRTRIKLPLREIEEGLRSIHESLKSSKDDLSATADPDYDLISRVVIEDVVFRGLPAAQGSIDLAAKQAKISGDFGVVLFDGGMTLSGSRCKIKAPIALWSAKHDGFLLPVGYVQGHTQHRRKAFVSLTEGGTCKRRRPIPDIHYVDRLEEQEAAVFASLSRNMPAFAAFMLGMPSSSTPAK